MEAKYYKRYDENKVHCFLCPHQCRIQDGHYGLCQIRKNTKRTLEATAYGRVSAEALDPIEKKPLYHFHPGGKIYSVGSLGCNLTCSFCQNHTISKDITAMEASSLGSAEVNHPPIEIKTPQELVNQALALLPHGNIGIAFTYNEPLMNIEYVLDTFQLAKENNLKTILVTNGYILPQPLTDLMPLTDAMNIDLKSYDDKAFGSFCSGKLSYVRDTIAACYEKCHIEVTTLVVPGLSANVEGIEEIAQWLATLNPEIPYHITRFFPRYQLSHENPPALALMKTAYDAAKKHLRYVFTGNMA